MAPARGERLSAAALAAVVALVVSLVLPPAADGAPSPQRSRTTSATAAAPADLAVTLTSVGPTVARPGQDTTIAGSVRNDGESAVRNPVVTVVTGPASSGRESVREWSAGTDLADGQTLARTRVKGTVQPGERATFRVVVKDPTKATAAAFAALPVSVESMGSAVHTFIGIERAKEFVPLEVSWAMPLTLPIRPALWGEYGEERLAAWEDAIGPDSALRRTMELGRDRDVLWLVDATLLRKPLATNSGRSARDERRLRNELVADLRELIADGDAAVLPAADADVAAGTLSESASALVRPQVAAGQRVAMEVGARSDVAWPADGVLSADRINALRTLYGTDTAPAMMVPTAALAQSAASHDARQHTEDGSRILVVDTALSESAGSLAGAADAVAETQTFLAETAVMLGELPGTQRHLLITTARSFAPTTQAWGDLVDAADRIPWLERGSVDDLLATVPEDEVAAGHLDVPESTADAVAQLEENGGHVTSPALTSAKAASLGRSVRAARAYAQVREDERAFATRINESARQLTSVGWRGAPKRWAGQAGDLREVAASPRRGLRVSSGDVNFFADAGRLQITVANDLDVGLKDLRIRVEPDATNLRLRIESQPAPITIAAHSRHTVSVDAVALAAGQVPVRITATDPDGVPLTDTAVLDVRVSPTGDWIYWGIGAIAAALLIGGVWRSVRRRNSTPAPNDGEPTA
ncbi:DUF6049 family protein [Janibacter sp. G56]|uniref:DUF6049 family protein n=1 Tax=Janibacter sp. G56 TaxID=3418717 RepID=UPI003CFDD84D